MLVTKGSDFEYLRPTLKLLNQINTDLQPFTQFEKTENHIPFQESKHIFNCYERNKTKQKIHERCIFFYRDSWSKEEKLDIEYWCEIYAKEKIDIHPMITPEEIFRISNRPFRKNNREKDPKTDNRITIFRNYNQWFTNFTWKLTKVQKHLLETQYYGIIGRDKQGYPVIYYNFNKITKGTLEDHYNLVMMLMAFVKAKMLIKGKMEQFCLCLDYDYRCPIFIQNLVVKAMEGSLFFKNNIKTIYQVRTGFGTKSAMSFYFLVGLMQTGDDLKTITYNKDDIVKLLDFIDKNELPKFLGGDAPDQVWPPILDNDGLGKDAELVTNQYMAEFGLEPFYYPCDLCINYKKDDPIENFKKVTRS